jgi:hypothetical protein
LAAAPIRYPMEVVECVEQPGLKARFSLRGLTSILSALGFKAVLPCCGLTAILSPLVRGLLQLLLKKVQQCRHLGWW